VNGYDQRSKCQCPRVSFAHGRYTLRWVFMKFSQEMKAHYFYLNCCLLGFASRKYFFFLDSLIKL
jgi:hypothetical protein